MSTAYASLDTDVCERDARQSHLRAYVRSLEAPRWQQRLAPLAQVLVDLRLVRGRNEHGAPTRHIEAEVLRETMCQLLREGDESAYLAYQALVEGMDADWLAAERGVSRPALVDLLRDATRDLAVAYEDTAYASVGQTPQERMWTAPARPGR
jgi:hypothetical protein